MILSSRGLFSLALFDRQAAQDKTHNNCLATCQDSWKKNNFYINKFSEQKRKQKILVKQ